MQQTKPESLELSTASELLWKQGLIDDEKFLQIKRLALGVVGRRPELPRQEPVKQEIPVHMDAEDLKKALHTVTPGVGKLPPIEAITNKQPVIEVLGEKKSRMRALNLTEGEFQRILTGVHLDVVRDGQMSLEDAKCLCPDRFSRTAKNEQVKRAVKVLCGRGTRIVIVPRKTLDNPVGRWPLFLVLEK